MWSFVLSGSLSENGGMAMSPVGDWGAVCGCFFLASQHLSVWLAPYPRLPVQSTQAPEPLGTLNPTPCVTSSRSLNPIIGCLSPQVSLYCMGDGARTQGNMRSTCNHSAYASDHDLVGLYTTACHLFRLTLTIQCSIHLAALRCG